MWLAMIISRRARPTPAFGSIAKSNARSGLATFIMILSGAGGIAPRSAVMRSNVELAFVDETGVAFGAGDGDFGAVRNRVERVAGADDGRHAELARDDRGVAGAAAAVRDDRGGALHDRFPIGIGHVGDQHVAGLDAVHVLDRADHARLAGADLLADRAAFGEHFGARLCRIESQVEALDLRRASARLHRFRDAPARCRACRWRRPSPIRCPSGAGSAAR